MGNGGKNVNPNLRLIGTPNTSFQLEQVFNLNFNPLFYSDPTSITFLGAPYAYL